MLQLSSIHIVIIEDDPYSIDILATILRQMNITYSAINDATKVISVLNQLPQVDIIFLDLELPKHTGFEIFQMIKNSKFSVPVIAYTSHYNQMATAKNMGFQGFLSKPVNGRKFPQYIQQIMQQQFIWE